MDFLANSAKYEPRQWVIENGVSCLGSSKVLNNALKAHAEENGEEWTEDIATMGLRPDPRYYNPEEQDRLQPSYADIEERFGITIGMQTPSAT